MLFGKMAMAKHMSCLCGILQAATIQPFHSKDKHSIAEKPCVLLPYPLIGFKLLIISYIPMLNSPPPPGHKIVPLQSSLALVQGHMGKCFQSCQTPGCASTNPGLVPTPTRARPGCQPSYWHNARPNPTAPAHMSMVGKNTYTVCDINATAQL